MKSNVLRHIGAASGGALALLAFIALCSPAARAEIMPAKGSVDTRIREVAYAGEQVYRLSGFVGYQIDLQFEPGETFIGLGAGDIEGLSFVAQANHLFLKPKAVSVGTNLTVLTTRRHYQFDYTASSQRPNPSEQDVIYALKFTYPPPVRVTSPSAAERIDSQLDVAGTLRARNVDYWYCGRPDLKPLAASDDGVHTRLRFAARAELPAIFVHNEDGSESLLNFSMDAGDVIVHRVARQYILRRGKLTGCIVNKGYIASGERLESGTIAPNVERTTHRGQP
jgi:type IV secretion system protein VirB9